MRTLQHKWMLRNLRAKPLWPVIATVLIVLTIGCSSVDDPVFGTRLPDLDSAAIFPTPIAEVPTPTPTPERGYLAGEGDNTALSPTSTPMPPLQSPTATPAPSPTPTPIPTEVPTPTPVSLTVGESGMTEDELQASRQRMLELINVGRLEKGQHALVLDDNQSAQLHANDMRSNCFSSQWGTDGSKPTLRYTRDGGTAATYSYTSGSGYCPGDPHRYEWDPITEEVESAYGRMSSDFGGFSDTYRKIGIGLSYRRPNLWVSLVLVTDHLQYVEEPVIDNGVLKFAYELTNGAVDGENPPNAFVHFDRPLQALTPGQLARTYSVSSGTRIAGIRPPAGADSYWSEDEFTVRVSSCPDPYSIDPNASRPDSYDEDSLLHDAARSACRSADGSSVANWVTSGVEPLGRGYRVTSDIRDLVSRYGTGIYTLQIWAVIDGIDAPVSEYSMSVSQAPPPNLPGVTIQAEQQAGTSGLSDDELVAARIQMLELINNAIRAAGLAEVVLDTNLTAQFHAEDMRENCFNAHWGSNGMKPYTRYTLQGGVHYAAENVSGASYCPAVADRYRASSIDDEVLDAHIGLMDSPGHRRNILDPAHRKVGLGFAYQRPNLWVVQLFTSDHIGFVESPRIESGTLKFAYRLMNGAVEGEYPPRAYLHYDRPLRNLLPGQLTRTYSYSSGTRVAGIRPPAGENSYWPEDEFTTDVTSACPDPYEIDSTAPPPSSYDDDLRLHDEAVMACDSERNPTIAKWVTARVEPIGNGFRVTADIQDILARHGSGLYTLHVWAVVGGESTPVSAFTIFVE